MAIFSICTDNLKKFFTKQGSWGSECSYLNLPILTFTLPSNHMGMEKGLAEKNMT